MKGKIKLCLFFKSLCFDLKEFMILEKRILLVALLQELFPELFLELFP
jgi:hypothetical protein